MTTSAERQRRRRQRLRANGLTDVTVTVPAAEAIRVRQFAHALCNGRDVGRYAGTRLPAILQALCTVRAQLAELGVLHAGVFGPTARAEDAPESVVNLALDVDAAKVRDVMDMMCVAEAVRAALPEGLKVEVVDRRALRPLLLREAERDLIGAF
jgi:predicted nucleotidyltransferase